MTKSDASNGPHLTTAVLCDKVLREHDNVLSLIRIVDRWTIGTRTPDAPEEMPSLTLHTNAVITFKSGGYTGKKTIALRLVNPDGSSEDLLSTPVLFEGNDQGTNIVAGLNIKSKGDGLYWIDVLLDDEPVTRMPLRFIYEKVSSGTSGDTQTK